MLLLAMRVMLDKKTKEKKKSEFSTCLREKILLSSGLGNKGSVNTPLGCSPTSAKKLWKNRLFQGLNVNELSSTVTRKSFQNQTEPSRFSVGHIPFIPSLLILRVLIQLVTEHVKAFEVWSKIPHWLQRGGKEGRHLVFCAHPSSRLYCSITVI